MATKTYIHELKNWPRFFWADRQIADKLIAVRHLQGRLIGRMEGLGFVIQGEAVLQALTEEVLKTSEIEGENLDRQQVRSSVARKLGLDVGGLVRVPRDVEGIVEVMIDATQNFKKPLTQGRLFEWHAALFPTGRSGMSKIRVGGWRNDSEGPMQVVSGPVGKRRVHFEAPEAKRLGSEMKSFFKWLNSKPEYDLVLKAAAAHFYFVTLHPFEDGNGRIARAIADMVLAASEKSAQRFYSMSSQISIERNSYYEILERTQGGSLDITEWMLWFLECLGRAIEGSEKNLSGVLTKARFWEKHAGEEFNDRQKKVINRLIDGFEGKLTSSKWAAMGKCSQDTASRDIEDLIKRRILRKNPEGGRSTSYSLVP
ncbi:MAG: Fic family protein [Pseudobdellovibrionaceae bacterium]